LLFLALAPFETLRSSIKGAVALYILVHNTVIVLVCGQRLSCVCSFFVESMVSNFSIRSQAQYELLSQGHIPEHLVNFGL